MTAHFIRANIILPCCVASSPQIFMLENSLHGSSANRITCYGVGLSACLCAHQSILISAGTIIMIRYCLW